MRTSTITKSLGLLALLGSSAGMAASVHITASTLAPTVGSTFTLTISSDVVGTFGFTEAMSFNASTVAFVGGTMPATGPWSAANGGNFNGLPVATNPTTFTVLTNVATVLANTPYDAVILTFQAIAAGAANIIINDDGGGCCGWFESTGDGNYIPLDPTGDTLDGVADGYFQANVVVQPTVVPAPATLGLLATGLAGLAFRSKKRAA